MGKVDFVIYEVGLGGRFDSTNIISPLLSVITNIGLDHTSILGDTHEEIAFEKAGIIKNDNVVITGVKQTAALSVITDQADNKNATLFCLEKELLISNHTPLPRGESFTLQTPYQILDCLEISMIGKHQTENASLAVMAAQYMNHHFAIEVTGAGIRTGLKKSFWPGRFETISENPMIIIDGAHNEEGVNALVHELNDRYHNKDIHVVFAALRDKKLDEMIAKLDQVAERITFVSFDFPRAASARELFELSGASYRFMEENWKPFLAKEMRTLQENQLMVITGSLYFISAIKKWYCQNMKD
jgi:dihydrofolate synthase / folylpolyglutamate synthase